MKLQGYLHIPITVPITKRRPNLLVATRQLEAFAMKYAMEHLTTNGTSNANITSTGEHFGELLIKPTLKLYAKLNTPSTIYKDLYRGATPRETT